MNNKVTFKTYNINQLKLPLDLEVYISENHLVKIVNNAIERMDLTQLFNKYKGGGTSAYHPMMMLKVLVYAYTQRIYTARKIAKALRENIYLPLQNSQKQLLRTWLILSFSNRRFGNPADLSYQ